MYNHNPNITLAEDPDMNRLLCSNFNSKKWKFGYSINNWKIEKSFRSWFWNRKIRFRKCYS